MKILIRILFFAVLGALATGFILLWTGDKHTGHRVIGFSVMGMALVLMPLFLIHRYKNKNFRDYAGLNIFGNPKNPENQ
ncbi:hypothetical protein [Sinomicrobium soli]|uniref:hypothetical protein n=1 Tax=Sinomicrobium sp. N-1-3-6 TaxID=2219864 RepID=UPI000DCEA051|nr:hypothetical protein [Sinomicrobium sp. N-1-3-6]RAV29708.1 hypothetical protein DN748_06215 [Sinomicrobium sp. N-1-3-6]